MLYEKEIILASNNQGKIKEFTDYFNKLNIKIIPQDKLNIPQSEEPFSTFVENALIKAKNVFANTKTTKLVLADDSGICADALDYMPGVISARYAGINKSALDNNKKLNLELKKYTNKQVYYICILVLLRHLNDPDPIIVKGKLNGVWVNIPKGNNGFGYDSHFFLPKYNKTLGQLDIEIKNKISHRAIALEKIVEILKIQKSFHP